MPSTVRWIIHAASAALLLAALPGPADDGAAPPAPSKPVTDTYFGKAVGAGLPEGTPTGGSRDRVRAA